MFLTGSVHGIFSGQRDGLLSGRQREREGGLDRADSLAGSARVSSGSGATSRGATGKVQATCSQM